MLAVFLTQFSPPFSSYAYDAVFGARIAIHNCTSHKDSSNGSLPIATDCIADELSHINVTGETVRFFILQHIILVIVSPQLSSIVNEFQSQGRLFFENSTRVRPAHELALFQYRSSSSKKLYVYSQLQSLSHHFHFINKD